MFCLPFFVYDICWNYFFHKPFSNCRLQETHISFLGRSSWITFYTIYHPICIYRYKNGYKVLSMCVCKAISKRAKTDLSLFNVILISHFGITYILYTLCEYQIFCTTAHKMCWEECWFTKVYVYLTKLTVCQKCSVFGWGIQLSFYVLKSVIIIWYVPYSC